MCRGESGNMFDAPTLCHNNFALFFCVHFHMERTGRLGKEEYGTGKQGDKETRQRAVKDETTGPRRGSEREQKRKGSRRASRTFVSSWL